MSRLEQLERFERRRGSLLEARLTYWLLRRGPILGWFGWPDQEDVLQILGKIGGDGYTRIVNGYLNSTNYYARIPALKVAARRPDWQTLAHLIYLSQKDEVHHETGQPFEQGYAALALAAIGEYRHAIEAVIRWGLRTLVSVVHRLAESPIDDEALAPAFAALEENGQRLPGAILALGTARGSKRKPELIERVRSILRTANRESEVAHACVIALRLLGDRSDEMVELVTPHLSVASHNKDAINALLAARSNAAGDVLVANLRSCFDTGLAIHLLNDAGKATAVAPLVQRALEKNEPYQRSEMMIMLLLGVESTGSLEKVIDDASARNTLHEAAFASAQGPPIWFVGSKVAAIRHLARFDRRAAWEAGRVGLENTAEKDRERYPDLLAEIDPLGAAPFILERMRVEANRRVRWAIGRALAKLVKSPMAGVPGRLSDWLASADPTRRRAACEVMGWLSKSDTQALRARLDDVDERVAGAAHEALSRLRDTQHVWEIAHTITQETNEARRWRLLDALIALGDSGDEHQKAPEWCRQVGQILSPAMRDHLLEGLKRRRKELARDAERT